MNRLQRHADRLGLDALRKLYTSALARAIMRGEIRAPEIDDVTIVSHGPIGGTVRVLNKRNRPKQDRESIHPSHRKQAADVLRRELKAIPEQVRAFAEQQATEVEVLTERLARRFDLGAALNEAAERAKARIAATRKQVLADAQHIEDPIERHYAQMRADVPNLTGRQSAALAVQRQTIERSIRRS